MSCLVVRCHPLPDSLNGHLADHVCAALDAAGHVVVVEDLAAGFSPTLTAAERQSYTAPTYDGAAVAAQIARLQAAEVLVLVFPTWWFGFPAVLKGWFDRVWAPGVAYLPAPDGGPIRPNLHGLRHVLAITTLGSPGWIDRLVLRRPVRRVLKTAILHPCAPQARLRFLALHQAEQLPPGRLDAFLARIDREIRALPRR